jgi:hypothetical protein
MEVLVELHHCSPFPPIMKLKYLYGVKGKLTWDLAILGSQWRLVRPFPYSFGTGLENSLLEVGTP